MSYIDGFVAAVPQENKQAYLDHAREARSLFKDPSTTRMVENWGNDVPEGKVTDFHRSVQKKDGEVVLFSWIEWPPKDVRDAPRDEAKRLWVHQIQPTIADLIGEAHDTHHPLGGDLYYEGQKSDALRRAKYFREERIPKFLGGSRA